METSVNVEKSEKLFTKLNTAFKDIIKEDSLELHTIESGSISSDPSSGNFDLRSYFEDSIKRGTDSGIRFKKVGVSFKNLTVVGKGADASSIEDNLTLLKKLWPGNWFKSSGTEFDILHDVSGFCKDGEMLLVLGRPESGCSSLLKTISNNTEDFVRVEGEVSYGGLSPKDFHKYNGEATYISEEDYHFPTLTLRETLDFALRMKTPNQRIDDETRERFRQKMLVVLMKMFGLSKQSETKVGDATIRGLSGGERKRLTIAEAMISHGSIECWDCSTRGLDAASALDYARSLRIVSDVMKKTTVASFYQASDSIYNLFDKVLILDKGRCIYFGPTESAKQYFYDLGFEAEARKSTPDFLTGISNAQERKIREGFKDAPLTSFALEKAWKSSELHKQMKEEQDEYDRLVKEENIYGEFESIVREQKAKKLPFIRSRSSYTVSIHRQLYALLIRSVQILKGNLAQPISVIASSLIMGFVFGSLFYQIPLTASGGFTRGSALFSSLIFTGMMNQLQIPLVFVGRPVTSKHKSYGLYHVGLYQLAEGILDIPINLVQSLPFAIITYFMYGLNPRADKFFIYYLILNAYSLAFTQLLRILGVFSRTLNRTNQATSLVFIVVLTYSGYALPYYKMKPWFSWFYHINMFSYGFRAIFANEMTGLRFNCSDPMSSDSIPAGPMYANATYRTCALPGSHPGETSVLGEDYLKSQYDIDVQYMWLYIMALALLWIILLAVNVIGSELIDWARAGSIRKVYKGGNAPKINSEEDEKELQQITSKAQENMRNTLSTSGEVFSWRDLKYTVPIKKDQRLLLDSVEGWIKPGQMTALMGASGAGKTTLLDVLAKRKTTGKVEGTILLNGQKLEADFERITGYVEQFDVHDPYMTVREALRFSAKLRQDASIPLSEKYQYVENVLDMMEMSSMGDALIGSLADGVGISIEERKRLTIGMELVAKPKILFLDEPTSGLDAQSSYNIIKWIRNLANAGMPLVCTIHQPSSILFEHFDRLLLLERGGKTIYFGDIGENSATMVEYFTRHGARQCDISENPAEYLLEVTGAGVGHTSDVDWHSTWIQSEERKAVSEELDHITKNKREDSGKSAPREFATSQLYQTWELYKRLNLNWWRNPQYNFARIFQAIGTGLIIGFTFYNLGDSISDLQSRVYSTFLFMMLTLQLIFAYQPVFMSQRESFRRDYASKFYSWAPFSVVMILVELPYLVIIASICVVCAYFTAGLQSTTSNDLYFWINFILFMFFCLSFAQLMAAISPNLQVAMAIVPAFANFMIFFAGVLSRPDVMPTFWKSWMYPIDPFHYWIEGQLSVVLQETVVECTSKDFFRFYTPPGSTCGEYLAPYMSFAPGYVNNPESTDLCEYCQLSRGSEFVDSLQWSYDHRWRNFGILAGFWIFNVILSCALIYLFRKPKR